MINIYIGYDHREKQAYEVCKHSIIRHATVNLHIQSLNHKDLRKAGLFTREWKIKADGTFEDIRDGRPFSTEFAFTRFLVPFIQKEGWALFCDSDMLFTSDIKELLDIADDKFAVMVVKHQYKPEEGVKMDGCKQEAYSRKNWSSFILWNCNHPANKRLTLEQVNFMPGNWLHNFKWLNEDEIGALPEEWNWLEGHSIRRPEVPKNIHYTRGGPWFDGYKNVEYSKEWLAEYGELSLK
jgi:lipopolysaccharide biosynthesis glycosyltransferase